MLFSSTISLFATTLLFSSTISAAPTRTHCRCTVVADTQEDFDHSNAHWTPTESSPSPIVADICSNLGPELEHFQHTEPDLYDSYVSRTGDNGQQRPLTTNVLLKFAKGNDMRKREGNRREPRPTARPHQRIVCRSEADPFTAYQDSYITLWALQIIMTVAILACLAEGVHLSVQWYESLDSQSIRLPGSQNLPLKISESDMEDVVLSGSEKKTWAHGGTPILVVQGPNGDRVCITYDEYDDDEINRPVM
jgi:hypothetical protein